MRGKDLGYRRIQCTGRGSHVISLPKKWVQEIGLKKGSQLAFILQEDSSLLLVPRKVMERRAATEKAPAKEYYLSVGVGEDPMSVCRRIISLYVVSADVIHIHFKGDGVASRHRRMIKRLVKNTLLGSEIIDESPNSMTIQILINHPEFSIEKAIRRMAVLALSANKDSIMALKSLEDETINNILETCNDVNRLNLYVLRQLKYGLERNLFKELGFRTPKEFLGYRVVANDIKGIADNAANIAKNIITLKKMISEHVLFLKDRIDEEVYSQILNFNSLAHQIFDDSIKALFKRDYNSADRIISEIDSSAPLENDLIKLMLSKRLDPNVSSILRLILDNSRRIMEYSRNIAEVTLNRTVEEITPTRPI